MEAKPIVAGVDGGSALGSVTYSVRNHAHGPVATVPDR
jgi:hypothetical protein